MIAISEIKDFLNQNNIPFRYQGEDDYQIDGYCPLNTLKAKCITWVRHAEDLDVGALNNLEGMLLVATDGETIDGAGFPIIFTDDAHRTFFKILAHFWADEDPETYSAGIASSAVVETSDIGEDVSIGHHTYIGPRVKIGSHVRILNNVTIQGKVSIGDYTVIESGTTIGACGFGHYTDVDGNPVCVPHLAGVVIGAHVKIGANNTISRGCLADTIIEDYVKTDNLVHIAHNDHIKKRAMLTACAEVSGSVTLGEDVWLAPGTTVNNSVELGDGVYTGLGAAVTKSQPAGKVVVGVPARILRDRYPKN